MPQRRQPSAHRVAREAALQMLYQWELSGADLGEVLGSYPGVGIGNLDGEPANAGRDLDEAGRRAAGELFRGVAGHLDRIDPLIADEAQNWRLERMAIVDRLVLRLATYELMTSDTPRAVVIDEALELARRFSGEQAVKFVNGVLDAVGRRLAETRAGASS